MHNPGVSPRGHVKSCLEGVDTNKIVMAGLDTAIQLL